ncbi:luciferase [Streptomyces lincolnensis]|uniref:Luciferase n=1 Tax=Streptomyces lincolnensis TaxID=1915 RepID=A0A1B1MGE8_STRLN|nr:LLM class flavin-dependent oxidoreductase [Streptomyces lincolnensis]ANS67696.1 luciferase [Streptomyces lincolnensis]AXG55011.1 luciferase [Streptomyces lincolnensis]
MKFGVLILPEERWEASRDRWLEADELGYDHAWTYDHLSWRTLRDGPWFGAVPVLAAAAAVTRRIALGPLVASPNFRHPVTFAKELLTLDDISGGRMIVGLGSGAPGADTAVLGEDALSPSERADRWSEFVRFTDELLREPATTRRGNHYTAVDARMHPGALARPRPPLALAAAGPRAMALTAQCADIWITMGSSGRRDARPSLDEAVRQLHRMRRIWADAGRDPADLRSLVHAGRVGAPLHDTGAFGEFAAACAEAGFTDLVLPWPRSSGVFEGSPRLVAEVAERVMPTLRG